MEFKIKETVKYKEIIKYEIFRKFFHIFTLMFLFFYKMNFWLGLFLSLIFIFLYFMSEILNIKGIKLIFFKDVSKVILRSRRAYSGKITYSPVFLIIGIFISYSFVSFPSSYIGIISVCVGDGLASILGKIIPSFKLYNEKTFIGSLAMFMATMITCYCFFRDFFLSILIGSLSSLIEIISFKELDNLAIPILISFVSLFISQYLK